MTRRAHRARRDPRSLLELRRLAYRVPRDEDARVVLVDALYETYPELFPRMIDQTRREDIQLAEKTRYGAEQVLWFHPKKKFFTSTNLNSYSRTRSVEQDHVLSAQRWSAVRFPGSRQENYKDAVIVYRTRGLL